MGLNTYADSFTDHPFSWVVLSVARTRCISIPWELVRTRTFSGPFQLCWISDWAQFQRSVLTSLPSGWLNWCSVWELLFSSSELVSSLCKRLGLHSPFPSLLCLRKSLQQFCHSSPRKYGRAIKERHLLGLAEAFSLGSCLGPSHDCTRQLLTASSASYLSWWLLLRIAAGSCCVYIRSQWNKSPWRDYPS